MGTNQVSSIYAGELRGLQLALELALKYSLLIRRLTIFTDSQAAIQAVVKSRNQSGQYLVHGIRQRLLAAQMMSIKVAIHWIPSHAEIEGNEQADILAKQATGWRKDGTGPRAPTFPSLQSLSSAAKRTTKARMEAYWEKEWEKGETGRELYRLAPKISKQRLKIHNDLPKALSAILTQIRTGKAALRSYLHRIKRAPDSRCTCGDEQTGRHVLVECPNFKELRKEIWPYNSQP